MAAPIQIKRYGVVIWGNSTSDERLFGVRVWVRGYEWANVCDGSKVVLFSTRDEAETCIEQMRSERDAEGLKK